MKGDIPDHVVEEIGLTPCQRKRYKRFLSTFIDYVEAASVNVEFGSYEHGEIVAWHMINLLKYFEREIREEERRRVVDKEDMDVM